MRGRGVARSVADGRQQLDRRESGAIIAGQLAFTISGQRGERERGRGCWPAYRAYRGMHSRAASIICTNVYMNDRAAAVDDPSAAP